jgi:hypothetical protein
MGNTKADRSAEGEILKFAQALSPKMTENEVHDLWKKLEHEHYVAEAKMLVMRSVFFKVLNEMDMKEAMEAPYNESARPARPDVHMFG